MCFYICFVIISSVWIDVCFVASSKIREICLSEFNVYFLNNLLVLVDNICAVLLLYSTEGGVMIWLLLLSQEGC